VQLLRQVFWPAHVLQVAQVALVQMQVGAETVGQQAAATSFSVFSSRLRSVTFLIPSLLSFFTVFSLSVSKMTKAPEDRLMLLVWCNVVKH